MNYCAAKLTNASIFLSQLAQELGNEDEDPRFPDKASCFHQNILFKENGKGSKRRPSKSLQISPKSQK